MQDDYCNPSPSCPATNTGNRKSKGEIHDLNRRVKLSHNLLKLALKELDNINKQIQCATQQMPQGHPHVPGRPYDDYPPESDYSMGGNVSKRESTVPVCKTYSKVEVPAPLMFPDHFGLDRCLTAPQRCGRGVTPGRGGRRGRMGEDTEECVPPMCQDCLLSSMTELPTVNVGPCSLRLEVDEASPELLKKSEVELNETHHTINESIHKLRCLLKQDKDLYVPENNCQWLLRFLRPTKFYPESAYNLIKNYYSFKAINKHLYEDLVPSTEKNVFCQDVLTLLPYRDQDGCRVVILQLGKKWDFKKISLDEVCRGLILVVEALLLEPATQINGVKIIFDMDGLSFAQTTEFTPNFAKQLIDWLQDCIPLRLKGIHIIRQPYIFNMVFNMFKPFLRDKIKSRILFHGLDRKSLHKQICPQYLPEIYGGTSTIQISGVDFYKLLVLFEDEFEAINSYGYNKAAPKTNICN